MSIWSIVKSWLFFGQTRVEKSQQKTEENIIEYVISLVSRQDLIAKLAKAFSQSRQLPKAAREVALIRLYFALEDFITRNKPLVITEVFTRESLREAVRKKFDLDAASADFHLIFLSDAQSLAWLFAKGANQLIDYIQNNLGRDYCKNLLSQILQNHPLLAWLDPSVHINPKEAKTDLKTFQPNRLTQAFKDLNFALYKEIIQSFGEKKAAEIFQQVLGGIKEKYDFDLISAFLEVLPEEVAAAERLIFLSREELEKKVVAATVEEKAKRQLAEKLTAELAQKVEAIRRQNLELEETKEALLAALKDLEKNKTEIENEKAKDEAVLASVGEGLFVSNQLGKITVANQQAQNLLGCEREEILGQPIFAFFASPESAGQSGKNPEPDLRSILTAEGKASATYQAVPKNRPGFPAHLTITPFILNGRITGRVAVFRDITRERDIDRAKSEFVSLASHQLRTPLSTINWYTEMLLAGDAGALNEEQKEYLEEVYHGNQRMVELVNALLNVSRIELGTFVIELEPVDVAEVAASVIKELQPKIREKELLIAENYSATLPPLPADSKLVRIILQNLLTNAVKYTPPAGKININISVEDGNKLKNSQLKEPCLLIAVADTGYGIPLNQRDKIFTKLFRADNVKEKETDGTGLGLYLVKAVLEASGGEIWFESEENKGSSFYVAIPASGMKAKKGEKHLS